MLAQNTPEFTRLARLQNHVAAAFAIDPSDRVATVVGMIAKSRRQPASYWLQLVLAMGIATFGLVLGSTAVVIGAMLISPLMVPIVELGMGLAVGSPFLVLRSSVRVAGSVFAVVGGAGAITLLLPFHQITSEISARTSPTVLDLLVAVCCAIAAAYAVVRPGSDTTATAAGTAVGIALVPPLCVVGYGLGTRASGIAGGASLLFTANFCAILLFAVISFVLLGYGQVHVAQLEEDAFQQRDTPGVSLRAARFLGRVFSSKYGQLVRFVMPVVLLIAVYLPLRRALGEVSWEVSARTKIQALLRKLPTQSMQSQVTIDRHAVDLSLVMVGKEADAAKIEASLTREIEKATGVAPSVHVLVVPDARDLRLQQHPQPASAVTAPRRADPALLRREIAQSVARLWPHDQAGPLLSIGIRWVSDVDEPRVDILHVGSSVGGAGEEMLAKSLSEELGTTISVRAHALPAAASAAEPADALVWLASAARIARTASDVGGVFICVERPSEGSSDSTRQARDVVAALLATAADAAPLMQVSEGPRLSLRVSTTPCNVKGVDSDAPLAIGEGGAAADTPR